MSPDIPDGLVDIRRRWSFADTLEAHLALDAVEEAREAMRPESGEGK
jgi:hypothetical protein